MVKVSDLGYQNKNLEKIPNKQQSKDDKFRRALKNLTTAEKPTTLNRISLPDVLLALKPRE